jgi:endoglucanase
LLRTKKVILRKKYFTLINTRVTLIALALVLVGGTVVAAQVFDLGPKKLIADQKNISIEWPTEGAVIDNLQNFKASIGDMDPNSYLLFWQVDDGVYNPMNTGGNGKEVPVDLSGWNWNEAGPYKITFIAQTTDGVELGKNSVTISRGASDTGEGPTEDMSGDSSNENTDGDSSSTQYSSNTSSSQSLPYTIDVWWPTDGITVSGLQPIKAVIPGLSNLADYTIEWKTGNGQPTVLADNYTDSPHKENSIDFGGWTWNGSGPYMIELTATQGGKVIAQKNISVTIGNGTQGGGNEGDGNQENTGDTEYTARKTKEVAPEPTPNPVADSSLYVPETFARQQARDWRGSRPTDAAIMDKIADMPQGIWLGNWNSNVRTDVDGHMNKAGGKMPVFIAYNIPGRDCGNYSAGGAGNASAYRSWIKSVADGIGNRRAIVVLEPDAIALTDCLSHSQKAERFSLIAEAVSTLKSKGAKVYIDAGHSGWISTGDMTSRLRDAGVAQADGFSLNVSNFVHTSTSKEYGKNIGQALGGKHFIVDTGRNGNGSAGGEWCNPSGRALGQKPTTNTGENMIDAYLWLKRPGESDGSCNGGPGAGQWWPEYALGLARNANY